MSARNDAHCVNCCLKRMLDRFRTVLHSMNSRFIKSTAMAHIHSLNGNSEFYSTSHVYPYSIMNGSAYTSPRMCSHDSPWNGIRFLSTDPWHMVVRSSFVYTHFMKCQHSCHFEQSSCIQAPWRCGQCGRCTVMNLLLVLDLVWFCSIARSS